MSLTYTVDVAFGLAFDVVRSEHTKSGFYPASTDLGSGKELFGKLRLEGFASLLRLGYTKRLVIVGGEEGRYKGPLSFNRAFAIREMLVKDYNFRDSLVSWVASASNSGGNIAAIYNANQCVGGDDKCSCSIVTSFYHIPRILASMADTNLSIIPRPAEAFWLLDHPAGKQDLIARLGGGFLAERCAEEIQGIAHQLSGEYKPRTNEPAKS